MSEPYIDNEEIKNVTESVRTKMRPNDKFVLAFENGFSKYIGTKHGVSVFNGTVALHLALVALGVKNGDEVIVPSMTSIGCTNAIAYTGAKAVFVDSTAEYWCADPSSIEKKITKKTKVIMPVHIYGHPCDMDPILELANKHDIRVVEDAAEAHGSEYKGKKVGNFSDISCYSFYGNKVITTGEGGMCLTNDNTLAETMQILRNQATKPEYRNKYYYDMIGFNYRMTSMQAAIGVAQLKRINFLVGKKLKMAKVYDKLFEEKSENVVHAPKMKWAKNTYWYYSVLVPKKLRDKVVASLDKKEIETRPFFYPIHMLPHYKTGEKLPIAEDIGFRGLNIPSGPYLTSGQIEEVVDEIVKITG